jgi:hypothetical protein
VGGECTLGEGDGRGGGHVRDDDVIDRELRLGRLGVVGEIAEHDRRDGESPPAKLTQRTVCPRSGDSADIEGEQSEGACGDDDLCDGNRLVWAMRHHRVTRAVLQRWDVADTRQLT